jgi:hypothetical protein
MMVVSGPQAVFCIVEVRACALSIRTVAAAAACYCAVPATVAALHAQVINAVCHDAVIWQYVNLG